MSMILAPFEIDFTSLKSSLPFFCILKSIFFEDYRSFKVSFLFIYLKLFVQEAPILAALNPYFFSFFISVSTEITLSLGES